MTTLNRGSRFYVDVQDQAAGEKLEHLLACTPYQEEPRYSVAPNERAGESLKPAGGLRGFRGPLAVL